MSLSMLADSPGISGAVSFASLSLALSCSNISKWEVTSFKAKTTNYQQEYERKQDVSVCLNKIRAILRLQKILTTRESTPLQWRPGR
jgi:hypothetical protein